MKKYVAILMLSFSCFATGFSQTFDCENSDEMVVFGPVTCESEGNVDYLSVTLMVTNFSSISCTAQFQIDNLPPDVSVNDVAIGNTSSYSIYAFGSQSYDLAIPSDGCAEVPLNFTLTNGSCEGCDSAVLSLAPSAPIPTIGQWGLILLSILLSIFGVMMLKKTILRNSKVEV